MSNFPRDEFDRVPENSARHGVHRASLEAAPRSLVPLMIFGVAALCIGLVAFLVVPRLGAGNDNAAPPAVVKSQTTAAVTPPASEAPTPTPSPTPTPKPTPASQLDKTIPVAVFNAAGIGGLAAKYTGIITGDGWTVSQAANWSGQPQATSVIYYDGATQKDNAAALGTLLGITSLVDTADLGLPLAVVLGPGTQ